VKTFVPKNQTPNIAIAEEKRGSPGRLKINGQQFEINLTELVKNRAETHAPHRAFAIAFAP